MPSEASEGSAKARFDHVVVHPSVGGYRHPQGLVVSIRGLDAARRYIYVWMQAAQLDGQLRLRCVAGCNAGQTFQWNVGMIVSSPGVVEPTSGLDQFQRSLSRGDIR